MEPTQTTAPMMPKKSNSGLIVSVIIVLAIILVGLFLLKGKAPMEESVDIDDTQANSLTASDEVSDIEADLDMNADIDSIDKDLQ